MTPFLSGCSFSRRFWHRYIKLFGAGRRDVFGKPDQNTLGPANVAQPVTAVVLNDSIDELGTGLFQAFEGVVEIVYREHDTQIAECVDRRVAVVGNDRRVEKPRQ